MDRDRIRFSTLSGTLEATRVGADKQCLNFPSEAPDSLANAPPGLLKSLRLTEDQVVAVTRSRVDLLVCNSDGVHARI